VKRPTTLVQALAEQLQVSIRDRARLQGKLERLEMRSARVLNAKY
jgi:hypothetical protein